MSVPRLSRLVWVGPLTVAASSAAVVAVQWLAVTLFSARPGSAQLAEGYRQIEILRGAREPALFTVVLVSVAVLVFAIIYREAARPLRTFQRVALVALVVSFLPDIVGPFWSLFGWPVAAVFIVMHVAAWAVCVIMLNGFFRHS